MKEVRRMIEEALMNLAKRYAKDHIDACETWEHGVIDEVTTDDAGNICVHYEDGIWFHYSEGPGGIAWW